MTHAAKIAREEALTDALRIADQAIGDEPPTAQALRILKAIKRLRDEQHATVRNLVPVDYLAMAQEAARAEWQARREVFAAMKAEKPGSTIGPEYDASATIDTPIGKLTATAWRTTWMGNRGRREVWAGSYMLNGEPVSIAEIKAAGLAQRPTTRNRQRKDQPK